MTSSDLSRRWLERAEALRWQGTQTGEAWMQHKADAFEECAAQLDLSAPESPDAATASGTPNETGDTTT